MSLSGLKVILFEARHAKTLADLVAKQGGEPFSAPAMKEVPIENNPQVLQFGEKLLRGEVDLLVLLTGVGTRYMTEILETKYPREKILRTEWLVRKGYTGNMPPSIRSDSSGYGRRCSSKVWRSISLRIPTN